jgi:hypothetical protein
MPFLCDGSGKKQQNLPDLLLRVSQAKPYLSVGRHPIGDPGSPMSHPFKIIFLVKKKMKYGNPTRDEHRASGFVRPTLEIRLPKAKATNNPINL